MSTHRVLNSRGRVVWTKWTEPTHWQATPKWHPRRFWYKQTWRRFHHDYSGFAYENEGQWEYQTDIERATGALLEAAGLPDATGDDAYECSPAI